MVAIGRMAVMGGTTMLGVAASGRPVHTLALLPEAVMDTYALDPYPLHPPRECSLW